jgi:hypothetical protein
MKQTLVFTHFISEVHINTNPKNQLENSVYDFLKDQDRILVSEACLNQFMSKIKDEVVKRNEAHKRCKPMSISKYSDAMYFGPNSWRVHFSKVNAIISTESPIS